MSFEFSFNEVPQGMIEYKTKSCPKCGEYAFVLVRSKDIADWKAGVLIQKALPYLTATERERMITGYCDPCWNSWGENEVNN